MGCDGGTIPKRKEIVKNKDHRQRDERDRNSDAADQWKYCAVSRLPLTKPIVASNCGHVFSKESIIEYLLSLKTNPKRARDLREEVAPALEIIRNLRDVKELKLKDNPSWAVHASGDRSSSRQNESSIGRWVCPITGLETNGKYRFYFSWNCGCLVSERALNQVPNDDKCIVCQMTYNDCDLVLINPQTDEDIRSNETRLTSRKLGPEFRKGDTSVRQSNPQLMSNSESPTPIDQGHSNDLSSRPSCSMGPSSRKIDVSYRKGHSSGRAPHSNSHSDHPTKRHKSHQ